MTDPAEERFPVRLQAPIYAVAFFAGNIMPMVSVAMPLWALELGASPLLIGLIISSRHLLVVALGIHGGALIDRFGARQMILIMGLAGGCMMGLYPFLPFIVAAIILQTLSGFCDVTGWMGTQAMVGQLLKGQAVYAGRMAAAARCGGFIAPSVTGLAWQYYGPYGAFSFIAGWIICGALMSRFLATPPKREAPPTAEGDAAPAKKSSSSVMPSLDDYKATLRLLLLPAVALVMAATVLRQTGGGMQSSFFGVWLKEIGFSGGTIGLLIGISNACSAGAALSVGRIARRIQHHWLLILAVALAIIPISLTPQISAFWLLAVAMGLRGAGQGFNLPMMMSIASHAVGHDLQGRVVALRLSFNRFGGALFPLVIGGLAELVGVEYAFYLVGTLGVVLLGLLALWVGRSPVFKPSG